MRDELLALLEEGPSSHTHLAKVLSRPREQVRHELRAMGAAGEVKRHADRWCLPGYEPPSRQYPNSQEARVVAAVGAGHQHVHSVSRATGLPTGTSSAVLSALCRKGQIVRLRREFGPNGMPIHIYGLPPKAIPRTAEDLQLKVCQQCGKGFDPHSRHSQCPACREPTASFAGKREVPRSRQALAAARVEELLAIEEVSVGVTLVCPGPDCGKRFAAHRAVKGRFCSTVCAETPRSDRRTVVVNGIEYVAQSVGGNYFNEVVVDAPHQGSSLSGGSFQVRR